MSHHRLSQLGLLAAICAAPWLSACGRPQSAPSPEAVPARASFEQQTEQKLEPLTQQDVAMYLDIMRAAAERVGNPTPDDRKVLEEAGRLVNGAADRRVPTPEDANLLNRATLVALRMDQIVAEELGTDGRTYRGIAAAVESALFPQEPASKGGMPAAVPAIPTPLQARLSEAHATNSALLAPYRDEIERVVAAVRNPANLPH